MCRPHLIGRRLWFRFAMNVRPAPSRPPARVHHIEHEQFPLGRCGNFDGIDAAGRKYDRGRGGLVPELSAFPEIHRPAVDTTQHVGIGATEFPATWPVIAFTEMDAHLVRSGNHERSGGGITL